MENGQLSVVDAGIDFVGEHDQVAVAHGVCNGVDVFGPGSRAAGGIFCGELSTSIFVLEGRGRSRSTFRSKEKARLSSSGMGTGVAPRNWIMDW